jgi:two-component system chemotaxis response regulator CheB
VSIATDTAEVRTTARANVNVVAIGASAGGVGALPIVLAALPHTFAAAVVVVQHLDPRSQSFLGRVLARQSHMPVREAATGDVIEPGIVYVAPPGDHLTVRGGKLVLTQDAPVHFSRPSVDVLFTSVAAACGPRAIGVILTGAGMDGAAGVRAIKKCGGRTVVQDPRTAEYTGMPSAASATGCADFIVPLSEIGPVLARMLATPRASGSDEEERAGG